nr:hypothetical protein [Tanacetum cinerariifolium]
MDSMLKKDGGVKHGCKPLKSILKKTSYTPPGCTMNVGSIPIASFGTTPDVNWSNKQNKVQASSGSADNVEGCHGGNETVKSTPNATQPGIRNKKGNFRILMSEERIENHDIVLPKAAIDKVINRYENSLVGFFVGKSVAFPIVQNYVKNTWGQFGLEKLMKSDDGVFLFKFGSKSGLEQVLEHGSWMIYNSPLILSKWIPYVSLNKNEVTKVPVWIKLRKIPLVSYSEDGLSLIATQVGKPLMLDAFTSQMWSESWGRTGYARALVEIIAKIDLKYEVSMAIPIEDGEGYTRVVISVEYEWKPPHCTDCQVFGYTYATCPKCEKIEPSNVSIDEHKDGFTKVIRKKKKGSKAAGGIFAMPQSISYQPKKDAERKSNSLKAKEGVFMSHANPFDVLSNIGVEGDNRVSNENGPKTLFYRFLIVKGCGC